ncbi:GNAT family protein [Luteimonas sp. MC1825]|uniref:GNAT family N-acetyltransferase n=1 Tax=Luteimonas sp. MC1825 TaxID=2761107 RepID=UPI0016160717|nr:GNAT family protein [Luteimonas sp. MC1825]MBB6600001.1 GNAT family N-acetyltransferase [Luteimonas sp. MC1825]QOC87704.1 GNAT family N-acetyltransferase [Luteimonas sp. MC1825]
MNIEGKRVLLRAIEPSDLPSLQTWANDPAIQRMLGGWHFPTSHGDQLQWLSGLSCNARDQRFAIEAAGMGLIGTANLVSIDWKNRNAFHGMLLGDAQARGKGFGVDTIMAVMRYAFDELGMARLDTDIIEYNEPSIGVYVGKCGWLVEGRKVDAYFRGGRYWDKLVVGITRDRYHEIARTSGYWG